MHIDNLILEVTRKCNLRCEHCMRGNPQRLVMSNEIINKTLEHVTSIGTLCLTGGEPSLAPEVLENLWLSLWWKKLRVEAFDITTNACPHNRYGRFLRAVDKLYGWCDSQSSCNLSISRDQYHGYVSSRARIFKRYMSEEYYGENPPYFHPEGRSTYMSEPICEGRALKTGAGWAPIKEQKPWELDEDYVGEHEVYISANGNVTSCCDMSFARIDRDCKGNVLTTPLPQIIESYCNHKESYCNEEVV